MDMIVIYKVELRNLMTGSVDQKWGFAIAGQAGVPAASSSLHYCNIKVLERR